MTTGKALLGVVASNATGTVIGILLATDNGGKLRKNISRKIEDLAEAINDKIDEKFAELLKTIFGKVKESKRPGRDRFGKCRSLIITAIFSETSNMQTRISAKYCERYVKEPHSRYFFSDIAIARCSPYVQQLF